MSEITPEKVAATPPTVELVADLLTEADNNYHDGHYWKIHLSASGNVVNIGVEPSTEPDEDDLDDDGEWLPEVHFRAVVVEGETAPIVLSPAAQAIEVVTDLTGTLWLACAVPGCREPLTVVEDGKTLGELAAPWTAHTCAEASQAEQNGGAS